MNELKANVEKLAAESGKTLLEMITDLQAAAAKVGNEQLLDMLCELKWEFIEA